MRLAFPVLAGAALIAGASAVIALPRPVHAADDSPHDAVEKLMPQLLSEDDATRVDAEKKLFALGEPGRAEMERMTRDPDARRAITALRLLGSKGWTKTPNAPKAGGEQRSGGELRVHRDGERAAPDIDDPTMRLDDLQAQIDRQMQDLRRQFEGSGRTFTWISPDADGQNGALRGNSSGTIVENDKRTTWTIEDDGRVKVTTQDGKDAPDQTFEAKSMDELKKEHPDVAKRVESFVGRVGRRSVLSLGDNGGPIFRGRLDRGNPLAVEAPQAPVLGVEWSEVPDVLREQLDLASGGMVVERVVPDSLAAKLGVAKYDVLVEVQGKKVDGAADVRKALEDAKTGDAVKAVVVRKGQKKTLETTK
jgi:hypothetical protein